jgi:hypothetical protein
MKYLKIVFCFIIQFAFLQLCFAQHITDKSIIADSFLNFEYKIFNSFDEIDKHFLRLLKSEKGVDLSMVNPGKEYNKTNVVIKGLPNKRLIMIGKSIKKVNFVLYENGGNAVYNICFVYKKIKRRYYDIAVLRLDNDIDSMEKLRDAIQLKKFTTIN